MPIPPQNNNLQNNDGNVNLNSFGYLNGMNGKENVRFFLFLFKKNFNFSRCPSIQSTPILNSLIL